MNPINLNVNSKLMRLCAMMIVITLGVYWLIVLRPFLVPLVVAILLSILVSPITFQLEQKGLGKIPSIVLTLVLFLGLIAGVLYVSFAQISDMIEMWPSFQQKADVMLSDLKLWLNQTFGFETKAQINDLEELSAQLIQDNGSSALKTTTAILTDLALLPLYMFFMLYYRIFFWNFLYNLLGISEKMRVNRILFRIYDVIHNYLAGLFTVMVIVGALNTFSLLVLDIQYAVFFGFFAALLLLIPYIGVIIGSSLPIMMALVTKGSPMYAVGVGAAFMTIQLLEGNFITPYIVGSKISINPLMAIVALLLGGMLWGIPGMILALPMVAIIKVIFDHSERLKAFGYLLGEQPTGKEMNELSEIKEEAEELTEQQKEISDLAEELKGNVTNY